MAELPFISEKIKMLALQAVHPQTHAQDMSFVFIVFAISLFLTLSLNYKIDISV